MPVLLLKHRDVVKPVFVNEGVDPSTLLSLLQNLFPSIGPYRNIVGVRSTTKFSEYNADLALVCETLHNFTDRVYTIMTTEEKMSPSSAASASQASSGNKKQHQVVGRNSLNPGHGVSVPLTVVRVWDEDYAIAIYAGDVEVLDRFYIATRLNRVSLSALWDVFRAHTTKEQELLTKEVYFDCVDELLKLDKAGSPKAADKVLLSGVFDAIFEAFDHDFSGMC